MPLKSEFTVSVLDCFLISGLFNAQDLVIVLLLGFLGISLRLFQLSLHTEAIFINLGRITKVFDCVIMVT